MESRSGILEQSWMSLALCSGYVELPGGILGMFWNKLSFCDLICSLLEHFWGCLGPNLASPCHENGA
eukprot:8253035-Karenia_brevis.AAC.1